MLEHELFEKQTFFLELFDDELVAVFHEYTLKVARFCGKLASVVNHLNERQIIISANVCVVFTESGSDMNHTAAVRQRDVVVACNVERLFIAFVEVEQRDILLILVILALFSFENLVIFEERRSESRCENVNLTVLRLDFDVIFDRVHTQRDV